MNKKLAATSGLILGGLALVSTAVLANYGDDNSLKGKVKVSGTSTAIKGAKVKLYSENGNSLKDSDKTKANGKYKFKDLSEKKYRLEVTATGYRNPKNVKKDKVKKVVDVDGETTKNVYLTKK